jgi:hypothetical protein
MNEVHAIRVQKESLMMRAGLIPTSEFEQELCSLEAKEVAAIKEYRASRTWNDTYQETRDAVKKAAGQAVVRGLVGGLAGAATGVAIRTVSGPPIQLTGAENLREIDPRDHQRHLDEVRRKHHGRLLSKEEAQEVAVVGAFTAVGTASFAIVGQAIIPIPGAGAWIGGAVGGIVGGLVGTGLNNLFNR